VTWLNYHHLRYFWTIVREGSVTRAAEVLRLAQPTLSAQIRQLEGSLGVRLFERKGRGLVPTEAGRTVFRYADEIFTLGHELREALQGRAPGKPLPFVVGVSDVLPKLLVHQLLQPALALPEPVRLVCHEDGLDALLERLFRYELDLVLSEAPLRGQGRGRAFSHLLGACGVDVFGTRALIRRFGDAFPACLHGAPMLLPSEGTALRAGLERWLGQRGLRPVIRGEFDDNALLKMFGRAGEGFFAAPDALSADLAQDHGMVRLGAAEGLKAQVYALSAERRLAHPAVLAIRKAAQEEVFT